MTRGIVALTASAVANSTPSTLNNMSSASATLTSAARGAAISDLVVSTGAASRHVPAAVLGFLVVNLMRSFW